MLEFSDLWSGRSGSTSIDHLNVENTKQVHHRSGCIAKVAFNNFEQVENFLTFRQGGIGSHFCASPTLNVAPFKCPSSADHMVIK